MRPTLVIGDVHGHADRLQELLEQEGIVEGRERTDRDCEVVQLGDLGHFGVDTQARDYEAYVQAQQWIDVVLWGNHDRGPIDPDHHVFVGMGQPWPETAQIRDRLEREGRLRLAHASHGFLLTHAGLHPTYLPDGKRRSAEELAAWLESTYPRIRAIDGVATKRGGLDPAGGILWRDDREELEASVKQIFGHTSREWIRAYRTDAGGPSYCIDIGNKNNGKLAGIWLPEERVVTVGGDTAMLDG